ncbi:hypothetical protein OIV83_004154 [Microbotryomycetes sp. JL201]|nr:hypothetical protein OIV83_004154 [Microbotryomycetes sp. JL201]
MTAYDRMLHRTSTPPIPIRPPTPHRRATDGASSSGPSSSRSTESSCLASPLWSENGSPASPSSPFDTYPFSDGSAQSSSSAAATSDSRPNLSAGPIRNKGKQRQQEPALPLLSNIDGTCPDPVHSSCPLTSPALGTDRLGATCTAEGPTPDTSVHVGLVKATVKPSIHVQESGPSAPELALTPNAADGNQSRDSDQARSSSPQQPTSNATCAMSISSNLVAIPMPTAQSDFDSSASRARPRFLTKTKRRLSLTLAGLVSSSSPDLTHSDSEQASSHSTPLSSAPLSSNAKDGQKWKTKLGQRRLKLVKHLSFTRSVPVTRTTTLDRQTDCSLMIREDNAKQQQPKVGLQRARSQSAPVLQTVARNSQVQEVESSNEIVAHAVANTACESADVVKTVLANSDLFNSMLPREIQLQILGHIITSAQDELDEVIASGRWRSDESRRRWAGEALGRRDIVRVARVSRAWRSLAYDGQLWPALSTSVLGGDVLGPNQLLSIAQDAGPFVCDLDIRGSAGLSGRKLTELTSALMRGRGTTHLTSLDLTGCTSLTAACLHDLLSHSPLLESINLMALRCVVFTTINVIDSSISGLRQLNVNRCPNLNAAALTKLATSGRVTKLERLRAACLTNLTDDVLVAVLRNQRNLQSLDVSHNVELSDQAFVKLALGNVPDGDKPTLKLRRLNLSGCTRLSDSAAKFLADCVPELETLELADMGPTFHPVGLVTLLKTLPNLTKLDLEQGLLMTDAVLVALPTRLRHLVVSCCPFLTANAMLELIERCDDLVWLEADGTMIDDDVARRFISKRFKHRALSSSARSSSQTRWNEGYCSLSERSSETESTTLLSLLDARFVSRRLQKEVQGMTRPRQGYRGHWTTPFMYHDGEDLGPQKPLNSNNSASWLNKKSLTECDEAKVVVRSFYGNLSVDVANVAANYLRKVNNKRTGISKVGSESRGQRSRTNGGSQAVTDESEEDEENEIMGRQRVMSCVVS